MQSTKVNIHKEPTSKLIYYRVYRDESPFKRDAINEELDRRSFTSFDVSVNPIAVWEDYGTFSTGLDTLRPQFISVFEEEDKIVGRGRGLENYAFDQTKDIYTIMRTIGNTGVITGSADKPQVNYTLGSTLTWSELVLLYDVAKKMIKVTQGHLAATRRLMAQAHMDIVNSEFPHSRRKLAKYADIENLENWIKSFQEFFIEVMKRIKEDLCQNNMSKIPMSQVKSALVDIPIKYRPIASKLMPSAFYESVWDRLILDCAMSEEKRLVLSDPKSELNASIQALKDDKEYFDNAYAHLTLNPIKKI